MKYVALFILAYALGFMTYGMLHPVYNRPNDELLTLFNKFLNEEASKYAAAQSAEDKLKAADEMYSKMMILFLSQLELKGPENKPAEITVTIQPEKKVYVEVPVPMPVSEKKKKDTKKLSLSKQIQQNKLTFKSYSALWQVPFIGANDSRVLKLSGAFPGKLKRFGPTRTGLLENVSLEINQDPEKSMTKFEVNDVYDNRTFHYYEPTAQSFRSVPGDENLLFMTFGENNIVVLDLRTLPSLQGNLFKGNKQNGNLNLRKIK